MFRSRGWRGFAILGIVAVAAGCVPDPPVAVVVPVDVSCQGITGDNASSLGDSKATVGLLDTLAPGTGVFDVPGTTITATTPARIPADGSASPVRFDLDWGTLPTTAPLLKISRELLRLANLGIDQQGFGVAASGAQTASWATVGGLTVAATDAPLDLPGQTVSGSVASTTPGTIAYAASSRVAVHLDSTVAGVTLNTITLDCALVGTLPRTGIG